MDFSDIKYIKENPMKKILSFLVVLIFISSCTVFYKKSRRLGIRPYNYSNKYPNRHQLKPYFGPGRY